MEGGGLLQRSRNLLLSRILKRLPNDHDLAAALMDISVPTLKTWRNKLEKD